MHSSFVVSQTDPRPLYLQVKEQVLRRIALGDWTPGSEIPSIRALAAAIQVSVITIKRAYLELEREGAIVTRQGKGSFVADQPGLAPRLAAAELDQHLSAALAAGRALGLDATQIAARLTTIDPEAVSKRLIACELTRAEWTHEAHLAAGLWHVAHHGPTLALELLRTRIRRLNDRHGTANTATGGYHETITVAYVRLLDAFLAGWRSAHPETRDDLRGCIAALLAGPLGDRAVLLRYWSRAVLLSPAARAAWVAPDVAPFALPHAT